jgi:tetratricopeptide (TPR) repeat protein
MTWRLVALVLLLPMAARADWELKRSPFDARLVARYKQQLHDNPDDEFALGKLTKLYQQYRSVDELRRELSAAAAASHAADDYVVLGHLLRERGDVAAAAQQYEAALKADPSSARAQVALGDAWVKLGRGREARPLYEAALARASEVKRKRPLLRKLADLALASDRGLPAREAVAEAHRYFDELLRLDPRDDDTRRELAEALAAHGQPKEAAQEWRKIAGNLARDPARQGQAWQRTGELEEAAGDDGAALDAYRKAYAIAPRGHYLRREALEKLVGVYRRKDELRKLIGEWEQKWPEHERGFLEWELLARLYDEIGDAQRAERHFQRALALDAHAIDARKRLIALYERVGNDAQVIAEYRRLIASAPGEPRFRLELAERLMKSADVDHAPRQTTDAARSAELDAHPPPKSPAAGDGSRPRDEALRLMAALGRESADPAVHAQLAELYTRWGMADRALKEQELLVRVEPNDEGHLVALGELYYQRGNKKRALEIWRRLLDLGGLKKEVALAHLAEVYGEHDLPSEALELYQKAAKLAPSDANIAKGLASALERLHRDRDAEEVWQQLFDNAALAKQHLARLEAGQRLLTLLSREGRLGVRAAEYRARADKAKDEAVAAAYTLLAAEALLKMGRGELAAELLRGLAEKKASPTVQADALVGLAQVYKSRRRLKDAVAALKRASELAPERARELYPQIAELSLQLYQDQDALSYAKRAIELGPSDAQAQVRLGEVLEKSDDIAGAAQAYERALELNDRLWKVYFTLARLRIRRGEYTAAAQLYRQIIRRSPEEELVIDAARRGIDLEEYLGSLGELERELEPLAYAHADKPVYRNLLLELYDRYGTPLVARAHEGDASVRPKLELLGEHGVRSLLDVLVDGCRRSPAWGSCTRRTASPPRSACYAIRPAPSWCASPARSPSETLRCAARPPRALSPIRCSRAAMTCSVRPPGRLGCWALTARRPRWCVRRCSRAATCGARRLRRCRRVSAAAGPIRRAAPTASTCAPGWRRSVTWRRRLRHRRCGKRCADTRKTQSPRSPRRSAAIAIWCCARSTICKAPTPRWWRASCRRCAHSPSIRTSRCARKWRRCSRAFPPLPAPRRKRWATARCVCG